MGLKKLVYTVSVKVMALTFEVTVTQKHANANISETGINRHIVTIVHK